MEDVTGKRDERFKDYPCEECGKPFDGRDCFTCPHCGHLHEVMTVSKPGLSHVNQFPIAVIEWAQGRLRAAGCKHDDHTAASDYLKLRSGNPRERQFAERLAKGGSPSLLLVAAMDEQNGVAIPEHKPLY
jgi:hypothetical protein